MKLQFVIFI